MRPSSHGTGLVVSNMETGRGSAKSDRPSVGRGSIYGGNAGRSMLPSNKKGRPKPPLRVRSADCLPGGNTENLLHWREPPQRPPACHRWTTFANSFPDSPVWQKGYGAASRNPMPRFRRYDLAVKLRLVHVFPTSPELRTTMKLGFFTMPIHPVGQGLAPDACARTAKPSSSPTSSASSKGYVGEHVDRPGRDHHLVR